MISPQLMFISQHIFIVDLGDLLEFVPDLVSQLCRAGGSLRGEFQWQALDGSMASLNTKFLRPNAPVWLLSEIACLGLRGKPSTPGGLKCGLKCAYHATKRDTQTEIPGL